MNSLWFTYITGVASLLGFIVQVFDLFPKYGVARRSVFLVVSGVFLGSLSFAHRIQVSYIAS
ncbi:hypothetical protein EV690_2880 [Celerinatantimonas diazotrophica]|uniref:Uncharacterized protein n=1 Tax=Celerinatantimonas diazotrophica TaxID=412034 RepID=A0A4R1JAQ6_9GAMM|nr:hypothetical protein EV690_2880 [Celerinatantimonas diazotrophica]CAG9295951.1 hypothetical protein CEDIAZO_01085 [Celerinatantimonas diazotrophica]